MNLPCGCCTSATPLTPFATANPPGLRALVYRVGTFSSFLNAMKTRLSAVPGLRTRNQDDFAIALLDAWATVGDVLTFYQERIANEGYLRTSTERQSIFELAKLVSYVPRPGIAATVYLAYTLEQNSSAVIPAGSRTQSIPGQDQLPQSFETAGDLEAQGTWNNLVPRQTQPQMLTRDDIYIDGTGANLKANDPLLIITSPPKVRFIAAVDMQFSKNRTLVTLQNGRAKPSGASEIRSSFVAAVDMMERLSSHPASHPEDALLLGRSTAKIFAPQADTTQALLKTLRPEVADQLDTALANAAVTAKPAAELHAFRVRTGPFGSTAPLKPITDEKGVVIGSEEWPLASSVEIEVALLLEGVIAHTADAPPAEGRVGREAGIKIKSPSESASSAFSLAGTRQTVKVGPWKVTVNQDLSETAPRITFLFEAPLDHKLAIAFLEKGKQLEVGVDGSEPVEVARGQSASATVGVNQVRISYGNTLSVMVKAPTAPDRKVVALDSIYNEIVPGSWVAIERGGQVYQVTQVDKIQTIAITNYGISGRVSELTLKDPWLDASDRMLTVARQTTVSAQSEQLKLAEEPIVDDVSGDQIELGKLYGDLSTGRWLMVQGERTDVPDTHGVRAAELVMLDGVRHGVQQVVAASDASGGLPAGDLPMIGRPGDSTHSFLHLSDPLAYAYKRDTVAVYGNVMRATNGETRNEILGNGDGTKGLQKFTLRGSPLAYVPASTPKGVRSTLQVFINDIPWKEVDTLAKATAYDRVYITQTDNAGITTVTFGDGIHGMRVPSGQQNVRAVYRIGTGTTGKMEANQITNLVARPLGVTGVSNPLPATGAADGDSADQARANTPLAVAALDHLVSVQDYADYARTFAGIGKASAEQLSDRRQPIVYMTVAGADPSPIDADLLSSLLRTLHRLGDPTLPLRLDARELMLLVISAKIKVAEPYQFLDVAPRVRGKLLDTYSFAKQELGQSVPLSAVIAAIQSVRGVSYVDVTSFASISETDSTSPAKLNAKLAAIRDAKAASEMVTVRAARFDQASNSLKPAQLAFLSPDVPDTLILTEIPS